MNAYHFWTIRGDYGDPSAILSGCERQGPSYHAAKIHPERVVYARFEDVAVHMGDKPYILSIRSTLFAMTTRRK